MCRPRLSRKTLPDAPAAIAARSLLRRRDRAPLPTLRARSHRFTPIRSSIIRNSSRVFAWRSARAVRANSNLGGRTTLPAGAFVGCLALPAFIANARIGLGRFLAASFSSVGLALIGCSGPGDYGRGLSGRRVRGFRSNRDGLAISERLFTAPSDPGAEQQHRLSAVGRIGSRDLIVSYVKIAEVDRSQAKAVLTRARDLAYSSILATSDEWIFNDLQSRIAGLPQ